MSQSERLEQEDIQNDQDSIQPDPLLASPAQTTINQLPLLQYRNGFFQGHIDQFSQRQGKGIYYWSSGEIYYGEWNQDRMEGEGIFYFAFGGYAYGTFLEDKVHGYAVLCFSNGDYIAGFWERGVLTGKVIQYSKQPDDWCLYDYKEGSPEKVVASGKGNPPINDFNMIETSHLQKLVNKDLDLFAAEKPEFEDEQANITFLPIGEQGWYHGLAQHETPQGLGIVCHLENKSDRGLFKESVLDGPGRSIFENGDVYDGFFKGGKFNGVGVYFKGQTEQYLYGVYENSECTQALTLGNGYPHELIRTLKGDFKLEESEYIDRDTDFEVLILSELSRAQSMAEGVDQREWMSISRNAHEESRDHSLPLESQRSKNKGSRNTLEQQVLNAEKSVSRKGTSEVGQIGSQKNVNSVKSVKSIKNTEEEEEVVVVRRTDNVSNASSVKSNKGVRSVKEEVISQKQPSIQRVSASAHNSQTSVQSKGKQIQIQGSRVESRTSVHEDVIVQQHSKHSSKQRLPQNEEEYSSIESYNQNKKSEQKSRQAVSREVSGGSAHVSNVSEKKSQPQKTSSSKNRVSDQNASIGSHRFEEQRSIGQIQQDFINADNKRGGLRVSSPDVKTKFTEESPDRHIKSEVLEIHSARSGHSDRLNRKTHENINNEVHNIMDQIFRTDDSHLQTLQTEQSQGAIYYDLNGSFGSPVKPKKEHVLRSHLPERDHDDSRRSDHANSSRQNIVISHSSRAEIEEPELKVKTPINKTVEHSKAESYEEEQKDQVADQETMNNGQTLEKLLRQLGREVKSEVLDGALSNRSRLRRKTTEGYSEANQEQVIEEEIYRIMMSKIELLLREQTRTSEKVDEIKRIIETKLDPLLKNVNQGNQVLKKGLGEKVEILAREKDYDSNVDILRQMHQDLVHHTRLSNISLNITHTKLDTLLMAQDIQNPNIGNPELVLDPPYSQEMLSGQLFKSQYDKSPLEIRSAASTQEQPNSAMTAFLNQSHLRTTAEHSYSKSTHQHNYKATPQEAVLIKNHYQVEEKKQARQVPYQIPSMEFDETNYMSIASDSAPLKLVNTFTPNAKQLFSKNEHIFENLRTDEERVHDTPYQSKDSALSQSIIKFRNSIRQQTENNNPSDPGNQLSSRNYVLTQTPRDKITYLQTEESVSASRREPTLQSNKSSSKNNAPVTPERRAGRNNMDDSRISQASHRRPIEGNEADVSPDRYQPQGSSTPRPKESTGSNVKDKSRWNLGFCGQSEVIDEPEAFMGPKKFMKTSNVHQTEEDSRILQTNGQDTNRSHVSQSHLKVPSQNALRKSAVQPHSGHNSRDNYKPSSVKVVEQLVGGDRSHRERSDAPAYNGDMNVFNHFVVTSSNNRLHSPSPVSEYVRIDKGNASQRNMQSYNRGTQSASAKKYLGESNLRVREVNVYEEEGSQAYDRVNTRQNTTDENGTWRNSVGGGGSYEHGHQRVLTTGVSPIKIRREPMSAQNPLKNSVHEGRLGTVRWRLELEQVDDEFDNRTPQISQRNLVQEILGVDPNEDVREIPQHKVQASNKSSKLVSTIGGLLTSERNWEKPQIYIPQEQIHQEIYYVNEGDDPLSSRRSYKMSEQSRKNYPETKIVYPVQALENMGVMKTHPDDYIERQVNREVSTRKSGNSKKSSYNVIEDEDYEGQYQRENVQIRAWDQGLIENLHRGQNQSNVKAVYKNYHQ